MLSGMDIDELRAAQAPFKERYREHPDAAQIPTKATGHAAADNPSFVVQQFTGDTVAGLHPMLGGPDGTACSADMLLEALLGCAGVTLRAVITAMRLDVSHIEGKVEGTFDARGTLGIDRTVPVGVQDVVVTFDLTTTADDAALAKIGDLVERYCVVAASLADRPTFVVRRASPV